ncbi:MAG: type II restriction endonuclease [Clostridia bacterium]|nr:type II restriction endonuclease [Clostridia bacterium]MDY5555604.1 type II restriction endonuclease [Blautia sp.]
MDVVDMAQKAVSAVIQGEMSFCKFMSANDSGESGAHQVGFLISLHAKEMMFTDDEMRENDILKKTVKVNWQNGEIITESVFTWYKSKHEIRLTRFGRDFPFIDPKYTGALFVLVRNGIQNFSAYILNSDDDIQQFLDAFGMTPAETNHLINASNISDSFKEDIEIKNFISQIHGDFPASEVMSHEARIIIYSLFFNKPLTDSQKDSEKIAHLISSNPDKILLQWTNTEFRLFRALEDAKYGDQIKRGFSSVDEFIEVANKVLNRRKSRAGKSLEHHLAAIFDSCKIKYTPQAVTEGNKRPDFIFPSIEDYHNAEFSIEHLCSLAAKTTCKDRWRQILNEGNRFKGRNKYLCTLQQGISSAQMDEMEAEKVILVVPKPYISSYPSDRQDRIWTISKFIDFVKEMEDIK